MKKKFAITAAIITTMIAVIFCLSQPKDIISGTNGYQIDRVVYNGVDVTPTSGSRSIGFLCQQI